MAFGFDTLQNDVKKYAESVVRQRVSLHADWGLKNLDASSINSLQLWNNLAEWHAAHPAVPRFQFPLIPCAEFSINFGKEPCPQRFYAIDGSENIACEFKRGLKGGIGVVTYGYAAMQGGKLVEQFPESRELELIAADIDDLRHFSLLAFNQDFGNLSRSAMNVRQFATRRRTQLEFMTLSNLVDQAEPGSYVLLDGFLKTMYSPPTRYIHEIGKKAARKGVTILGVAKSSKIDMWLNFQEYWQTQDISSCWIRPSKSILDSAYPSDTGKGENQFVHLGEQGRGIGIPIATTFSPLRHSYYAVEFNCYDFEFGQEYLRTTSLPAIRVWDFPLTTKDKDFISHVLAHLAFYCEQVTCLGFPFPTAAAHRLVKITRGDVQRIQSLLRSEFLGKGIPDAEMREIQEDPHKIVDEG